MSRGSSGEPELHKVAKKPGGVIKIDSEAQCFEKECSVGMCLKRSCVIARMVAANEVSVRT